jgi:hypothetical protein
MNISVLPLEDVHSRRTFCPICEKFEQLVCTCGKLSIYGRQVSNNGVVFLLSTVPQYLSFWCIDLEAYKDRQVGLISEQELVTAIRKSPDRFVEVIIYGPCISKPEPKRYSVYFRDEIGWLARKGRFAVGLSRNDLLLEMLRKDLKSNQPATEPLKSNQPAMEAPSLSDSL